MSWTETFRHPAELRSAFAGFPPARFRPVPLWWWSGETLEEDRLRYQLEQIAALGCGGWGVTGVALHGAAVGSRADDPPGFSPEWLRLYRAMCEYSRELGLSVISWSPLEIGGPAADAHRLLASRSELRGEIVRAAGEAPEPFGFDYGNPDAIAALLGSGTRGGAYLAAIEDLLGDVIVGMFEDEFPLMPSFAPGFAVDFKQLKGYEAPIAAFNEDVGPATPARRVDLYDVAATRVERGYTAWLAAWCRRYDLLAGFDQMNRDGTPLTSAFTYFDPFRTMSWANAPGSDQMGDVRFALSLADAFDAPRVWLEGFHSHGWGMTLDQQMHLLYEWGREGATVFLPHGFYYATRAFTWEWAPPEMGWRQPYARHYPAFAEAVGRLMMALSAGEHCPEVAVLYPTTTVWAGTTGFRHWSDEAVRAESLYTELFGVHDEPSGWHPEKARIPSRLADAGYDRVAVDEARVAGAEIPLIVPGCVCLRRSTVTTLAEQAESGRTVILVEPIPAWSAEVGREDPEFATLVGRLVAHATIVTDADEALAALPPPRADGPKTLWRRVGDLDVVFATGPGTLRLRGLADRRPERWDLRTGAVEDLPASAVGADLVIELAERGTLLSLPPGTPAAKAEERREVLELPERWDCTYAEWGENRWGDYVLPGNEGTPPVERRTFAFREGDDPTWTHAPVTPEDHEWPFVDLGFEARMYGSTGRPVPSERMIADGWREVVSTYGPRAVVDGERLAEYSERYGVEDLALATLAGQKGFVEPVKVHLGRSAGRVVSHGYVESECDTHLVVEGSGLLDVVLDGELLIGPVEAGVVAIPVHLGAGWHELAMTIEPRPAPPSPLGKFAPEPQSRLAWVFSAPYRRPPVSIWGGELVHPDYKGSAGPRIFRRRIRVPERARLAVRAWGAEPVDYDVPEVLEPGEHVLEFTTSAALGTPQFFCSIELEMATARVTVVSDNAFDSRAPGGEWERCFALGTTWAPPADDPGEAVERRHPLTDVAWLEGPEALAGQVRQRWSDSPLAPPPAWFAFTAPPGAVAVTLPIVGEVSAFLDGEATPVTDGRLALRQGARVALRVQAPAGFRGAACFVRHPRFELGPGTIEVGRSWHRQGLDSFSGVIVHRAEVELADSVDAVLDLGELVGSVAVRVNGEEVGVLTFAPWRLPVCLLAGPNAIELEVANTLGPMVARGVPTPYGPEDQRVSGILGRPRLLVPTSQ